MSKAIQDNNWLYNLLSPLVQYGTRCHYNRFVVRGYEHLPTDGAYIIAPCHQQALMEPLAVLYFAPKPPVFLARADIFRKPTIRSILTFLRIMPVYRIRDGQDQLGRNKEIFDRCRDVLIDGYPLCLMAEGRHNNRHHLLNMGKGMFRIAGETQLALGDRPLYIVPTGIDFDDYERPYSNLVVNIGEPIPVQPFMEGYRDNEPVALNRMRDALFEALLPLMHDVRDEEHYDETITLCHVLGGEMLRREGLGNTAWNRFRMRQRISTMPMKEAVYSEARALRFELGRLHLDERLVSGHWSLAVTLAAVLCVAAAVAVAVTVPVVRRIVLWCMVCYPMPLVPTHLIVRRKVADPQFRSSFNFGVRLVLSILYAIVIGVVMAATGGAWMAGVAAIGAWWGLVAVAWCAIGARLAAPVTVLLRDIVANCRYWMLRLCGRLREVNRLYKSLVDFL